MSEHLDAVPGGVITLSNELRILAANETMGAIVGRDPRHLSGKPFDELLTPPARILFQTHVFPALKADGHVEEVFLTLSAADDPTPVLLNATRTLDGEQTRFEVLIVRIRARSRWEKELLSMTRMIETERAANERLARELSETLDALAARHERERRAAAFRDAFVGIISHELRTPITTIYGMSHVLRARHGTLPPDVVGQHLHDIASESDRLRQLTEDLLVLSRAEGHQLVVASEPVLIGHIVRSAVRSEAARFTGHSFDLKATMATPLVLGEATYIEQVTRNMLSNAAKYSPAGTTITTTVTRESDGVAVRVTDAGPGLGTQDPDRLFDVFVRTEGAIRTAGGAGIGLFVCRELIHAMGGRVWAKQAPAPAETGAEFGFWLPGASGDDAGPL